MFIMINAMVVSSFIAGLMKIVIAYATDSVPENISILKLWMPTLLERSWLFVAVYNSFILMLFSFSNIFASELVFITSAYLAASFDRLGDKVKAVIEGTENRSFLDTKRKLAECVDFHSHLIKLADESNGLYGIFNLTFVILISIGFCIIGITIMVDV
jgi:hypothetical protein